jgi:two-component system phosphate regulon sensor histidine kinase PhoR
MEGRRLFWQIFLAYVVINTTVLLLLGLYLSFQAHESYLDEKGAGLLTGARGCEKRIADPLRRHAFDEIETIGADIREATGMRVTVILADGRVVGDTSEDPSLMQNHLDRPEVADALRGDVGRSRRYSTTLRTECLYVAVPVAEERAMRAVVRTSLPVATLLQTANAVSRRIAIAAIVATLAAAAVSRAVARRIAQPLEVLRDGAERFARGALQHRLPAAGAEEIRALAASLNDMAEELDRRMQMVERQENELQAVLSNMQEGVLAVDDAGRILKLNPAAAALLDLDAEQVRGKLVAEVVRKAGLLEFVDRALAGPPPLFEEVELRADESRRLHAYGTPLYDARRRRIGALIVLHDVTKLRRLELIRREFVDNVSHELRTPITSIRGFLETVLHENFANRENVARFVGIALQQTMRLEAIIEDLLCLSRVERGAEKRSIPLEIEPVAGILQAAAEICAQQAAGKNISLRVQCPETLAARINPALLEQAVVNLIANAVAYSRENAAVRILATPGDGEVILCVQDDGCGIEARHLPRLFERFYRVDRARSRHQGGTGLGLAIVKHIALAHGGSVRVESEVGRGSAFFIHLPAAAAADPVASSSDKPELA